MDFDWNNPPFNLSNSISIQEIEESFEDPFAVRLMPDSGRFSAQARYFNIGQAANGEGLFTVYRTNGKMIRVIHSRPCEPEEKFFHQRKMNQTLGGT